MPRFEPDKESEAYRGYLLRHSSIWNTWYISKDGQHISSAPTLELAKRQVDSLLD